MRNKGARTVIKAASPKRSLLNYIQEEERLQMSQLKTEYSVTCTLMFEPLSQKYSYKNEFPPWNPVLDLKNSTANLWMSVRSVSCFPNYAKLLVLIQPFSLLIKISCSEQRKSTRISTKRWSFWAVSVVWALSHFMWDETAHDHWH